MEPERKKPGKGGRSIMETREIKIRIHDESDLFSPFDPDQKLLSDELTSYLAHNYINQHRAVKEQFVIRIISDVPVNQETVRQRIQAYYSRKKITQRSS